MSYPVASRPVLDAANQVNQNFLGITTLLHRAVMDKQRHHFRVLQCRLSRTPRAVDDKGADALLAMDPAVANELSKSSHQRRPGDVELLQQLGFRRNQAAGREVPELDILDNRALDLNVFVCFCDGHEDENTGFQLYCQLN